ncbi:unnamed protein product [Owenia fusiformis]|uniref:RING-type domain-containing protein n=1 Tax=Owenia fusiformis TaxID=6347 RepID=A0A8J1U1G4_OWEFU|nr:unnamed protein product [Owenia fusiformis]
MTSEAGRKEYSWSHLLVETNTVDELTQPIRASSRIKYLCLAVSQNYVAFGTNTGVIYIFQRDPIKYLQVYLADKDRSINCVEFGPDDNLLAYTTSKGIVQVLELNIEKRSKPERIRVSHEHKETIVTSLCWNHTGNKLFCGDQNGKVTVAYISSKAKDLFKHPTEVIMKLDSKVVQLDCCENKVLVSTLTRSYLCNTAKEKYTHIGTKPRDGCYGNCFFQGPKVETPVIYCARPGSRIWEVDNEGNVLNTHQFKKLLDMPSLDVLSLGDQSGRYLGPELSSNGPQSLAFPQLQLFSDQYLLTWTESALYIFNPIKVQVLLWNKQYKDITSVKCFKNDLYVLQGQSTMSKLSLLSVEKCILKLSLGQLWQLCADVCIHFRACITPSQARTWIPIDMLEDIKSSLKDSGHAKLSDKLAVVIATLEPPIEKDESHNASRRGSTESQDSSTRLDSGIYLINRSDNMEAFQVNTQTSVTMDTKDVAMDSIDVAMDTIDASDINRNKVQDNNHIQPVALEQINGDLSVNPGTDKSDNNPETNMNHVPVQEYKSKPLNFDIPCEENKDPPQEEPSEQPPTENDQSPTQSDQSPRIRKNSDASLNSQTSLDRIDERGILRHGSQESLSSSDMVVGNSGIDPEPVYAKSERGQRLKGRKKKASEVDLTGVGKAGTKNRSKAKARRSQSVDIQIIDQKPVPRGRLHTTDGTPSLEVISNPAKKPSTPTQVQTLTKSPSLPSMDTIDANADKEPKEQPKLKPNKMSFSKMVGPMVLEAMKTLTPSDPTNIGLEFALSDIDSGAHIDGELEMGPKISFTAMKESLSEKFSSGTKNLLKNFKEKTDQLRKKDTSVPELLDVRQPTLRHGRAHGQEDGQDKAELVNDQESRVDLTQLEAATKTASELLQNTSVKEADLRSCLTTWARELNKSLHALHITRAIGQIKHINTQLTQLRSKIKSEREENESLQRVKDEELKLEDSGVVDDGLHVSETHTESFSIDGAIKKTNGSFGESDIPVINERFTVATTGSQNTTADSDKLRYNVQCENIPNFNTMQPNNVTNDEDTLERKNDMNDGSIINICEKNNAKKISEHSETQYETLLNDQEDPDEMNHPKSLVELSRKSLEMKPFDYSNNSKTNPKVKNSQNGAQEPVSTCHPHSNTKPNKNLEDTKNSKEQLQNISYSNQNYLEDFEKKHTRMLTEKVKDCREQISNIINSISEIIHIDNPFTETEPESVMTELARKCFELEVHGDINEHIPTVEHVIDACSEISLDGDLETCVHIKKDLETLNNEDLETSVKIDEDLETVNNVSSEREISIIDQCNSAEYAMKSTNGNQGMNHAADCSGFKINNVESFENEIPITVPRTNLRTIGSTVDDIVLSNSLDEAMGLFTKCYFYMLDYSKVSTALEKLHGPRYKRWLDILECLKALGQSDPVQVLINNKSFNSAVDLLRSGIIQDPRCYLVYIVQLCKLRPLQCLDFCVESNLVRPLDVLYMCMNNDNQTQHFLHYMQRKLEKDRTDKSEPSLQQCVDKLASDRDVASMWLRLLLERSKPVVAITTCVCGSPRPGSHKAHWRDSNTIDAIINSGTCETQWTMKTLRNTGYWAGWLIQQKKLGNIKDVLETLLKLGDIELFQHKKFGYIPVTPKEWTDLLKIYDKQNSQHAVPNSSEICSKCGQNWAAINEQTDSDNEIKKLKESDWSSTVTWESLALLLVQHVDVDEGLKLLKGVKIPTGGLSSEFFKHCALRALAEERQRDWLKSTMLKIDTHLWSKHSMHDPPQLRYTWKDDANGPVHRSSDINETSQMMLSREDDKRIRSELSSHCVCCGLVLQKSVSSSIPGVIMFQCGHSFHMACIPGKQCSVCQLR